jgi:hypothetical protein
MVAPYTAVGPRFSVEDSHPWPNGRYQTRGRNRMFDLHPDDEHLVLALDTMSASEWRAGYRLVRVQFLFDDLKRLAPINK